QVDDRVQQAKAHAEQVRQPLVEVVADVQQVPDEVVERSEGGAGPVLGPGAVGVQVGHRRGACGVDPVAHHRPGPDRDLGGDHAAEIQAELEVRVPFEQADLRGAYEGGGERDRDDAGA